MLFELQQRVRALEQMVYDSFLHTQNALAADTKQRSRFETQPQEMYGFHVATCVDTVDPLKQGRIRIYTPLLSDPNTDRFSLPWAWPISPFGGFDDSGATWVPPAGSRVVILFHGGNRDSAYYIGTIWDRHRGADGDHMSFWAYPDMGEYACNWDGKRNGYLVGDNTGDQVLPPWNTESYNGYDNDSTINFYNDPTQFKSITYPNIKGFKTEEKHSVKFVDGDRKCNLKNKRLEINSSCGNFIIMKDDHLHPAGQYAFGNDMSIAFCHTASTPGLDSADTPNEWPCCAPFQQPSPCLATNCPPAQSQSGCSSINKMTDSSVNQQKLFANPFYKRQEEMRPYNGANTPLANKVQLPQSGIQFQSISGQQMIFDDSVDQPTGVPTWDRQFDFGCNDKFSGKIAINSATGHSIVLNDKEDDRKTRGKDNGIFMSTAWGTTFSMSDETTRTGNSCDCPPNFAGNTRGITAQTTSMHLFQMCDAGVRQCGTARTNGGQPKKEDKHDFNGYILLRSGYGLQIMMKDQDIQTETKEQYIQILAPQKDNTQRGPHMMVMQERKTGPGLILLRAGGVYQIFTHDDSIEMVGDPNGMDPANKFVEVRDNMIVDVQKYYFNHAQNHIFMADSKILLMAGTDCSIPSSAESAASTAFENSNIQAGLSQGPPQPDSGPCLFPVIVADDPWTCPFTNYIHYGVFNDPATGEFLDSRSNRVFASNQEEDTPAPTGTIDHTPTNYTNAGGQTSQQNVVGGGGVGGFGDQPLNMPSNQPVQPQGGTQ